MTIDTAYLVAGLRKYFETAEILAEIEKLKRGGILQRLSAVLTLVWECVLKVEELVNDISDAGSGSQTGKAKKQAVVSFLDEAVHLPFYLEMIDGPIISMAVDAVVAWYNLRLGHGWLGKVKSILGGDTEPAR